MQVVSSCQYPGGKHIHATGSCFLSHFSRQQNQVCLSRDKGFSFTCKTESFKNLMASLMVTVVVVCLADSLHRKLLRTCLHWFVVVHIQGKITTSSAPASCSLYSSPVSGFSPCAISARVHFPSIKLGSSSRVSAFCCLHFLQQPLISTLT